MARMRFITIPKKVGVSMQNGSKKILIVDDEPKIVEVLKAFLENDGYTVFEANDSIAALKLFDEVSPSLVLLDLMLPDISGEAICKVIRNKSSTPIIMLTAKVQEEDMLNGLSIGADDYIMKPFSPREVLARIAAVLRRVEVKETKEESLSTFNDYLTIDYAGFSVTANGEKVDVTPTEFKILATLSKSPGRVYTREQIIGQALGDDYLGYDRTIDTHVKSIRQKIEPDPKSGYQFIQTVHGIGYKFGGE